MLIYDCMNDHGRVNAWQVMPALIVSQGFDNRDGTVLTIFRKPTPPNNSKDLTGMEVAYALSLTLFVLVGRRRSTGAQGWNAERIGKRSGLSG